MSGHDNFIKFHNDNPNVYTELVKLAREFRAKRGPVSRIGMQTLIELIRWSYLMTNVEEEDFKINNNYQPYYSRLVMANNLDLDGMFALRTAEADYVPVPPPSKPGQQELF